MIVRCPGCQRRYSIAKHVIQGKIHYKLRCKLCGTLWRLSTRPPEAQPPVPPSYRPPAAAPAPTPPITHTTWYDVIKNYSLDWIILFVAVALAILLVAYEGRFITDLFHWSTFSASSTDTVRTSLAFQNVEFSTEDIQGQPNFIVKGEIVNPSVTLQKIHDLHVVAWGECEGSQRCMLVQWVHQMNDKQLPPGDRLSFQTIVPKNNLSEIKEIEVTWYSPS